MSKQRKLRSGDVVGHKVDRDGCLIMQKVDGSWEHHSFSREKEGGFFITTSVQENELFGHWQECVDDPKNSFSFLYNIYDFSDYYFKAVNNKPEK